jgi:hypothetical protein
MGWYGLDRSGLGPGLVESSCEHGNGMDGKVAAPV